MPLSGFTRAVSTTRSKALSSTRFDPCARRRSKTLPTRASLGLKWKDYAKRDFAAGAVRGVQVRDMSMDRLILLGIFVLLAFCVQALFGIKAHLECLHEDVDRRYRFHEQAEMETEARI